MSSLIKDAWYLGRPEKGTREYWIWCLNLPRELYLIEMGQTELKQYKKRSIKKNETKTT